MKFNRNATINQRIDRITPHHAVVGVDIAKDSHVAQLTDFRGRSLTSRHLSFPNSREGFKRFLRWIQEAQAKHGLSSLLVGMEPTGHYWFNLANWLLEQSVDVVLVNPVTTHRNKENRDNSPSKNDPKDALTIADVVSRGFYTDYLPRGTAFERIKTIMSDHEFWSKDATRLGNRIVRWIDLYFPEFRLVFKDWTVPRALATLGAFALPGDLQGLTVEQVIAGWKEQGMKRASGVSGRAKALELLSLAARSIGDKRVPEEARRDIKRLLDAYKQSLQRLDEIQREIEALVGDMPLAQQLQSIRGLGTITLAALLGCAGDLRLYSHGRQLLRRAGLNLAECTSGKFKGQIKLSKRGDSMLRKYLFLGVLNLVRYNEDFKRWHEHNVAKGMKKQASIFKLIGKWARITIGMVQRGEEYRSAHEAAIPAA
ncbi:Transposase IS116/IS110/IS902 family protein [Paenibacillus konkukensis]|uniref:Transposase IS116/IS110/IS902 family protein n=1 Tax=Paenibacillus konkukensis TaxID=2020716 RepID=A0ABY4RSQ9_9BACL|nr:IS110 family transposase [Paenibacillus konkukensis]UQZ85070.1 Transposase IS116/IS110/IS902 family protein [Paenibacillus konkukensis]